MAEWTWSDDEIDAQVAAGHSAADRDAEPRAVAVRYDQESDRVVVDLAIGTTYLFPSWMGQGLAGAAPEELALVELSPGGYGLRWAKLGFDLSVAGVLLGSFGKKTWMAQLKSEFARQAGLAKTEAKQRAARENGKRGGRPRKKAGA